MDAYELYDAGKLQEAIPAQVSEVKAHPSEVDTRGFLCELLCFAGDLERADKQLDAMGLQAPDSMIGISMFRQLLRGEMARRDFYSDGRVPEIIGEPAEHIRDQLQASIALREGKLEEAAKLMSQAEEKRPIVSGECDGTEFDDLRDLSDPNAGYFEVITSNGKYYWVPAETVESIEFHPPVRPRDLLWRRASMVVTDGPDGEVFLPSIYAGRANDLDDSLRLGRSTNWIEQTAGVIEGRGLRTFLIGDNDRTILELGEIQFSR